MRVALRALALYRSLDWGGVGSEEGGSFPAGAATGWGDHPAVHQRVERGGSPLGVAGFGCSLPAGPFFKDMG
jgi:hypothetical protein